MQSVTLKEGVLSFLYLLLVFLILALLNVGLTYFLNNVLFVCMDWFNRQHWAIKLVAIFFGGFAIWGGLMGLFEGLTKVIGYYVFKWFPMNAFTMWTALILSVANSIYNITLVWKAAPHYNFWIICELIVISFFIWGLSSIVIIKKPKELI